MIYAQSLLATAVGPTRIDLSWTEIGGPATITQVERSLDNIVWAPLVVYYYGLPTYIDDTCVAETAYWYRVRLYTPTAGWGPYCLSVCATTTALLDTTALTETVTPTEAFSAILTLGTAGIYGCSLLDVSVPVETCTPVLILPGLFPKIVDKVYPVEIFTAHLATLQTLALGDVVIPTELPLSFPHGRTKAITEHVSSPKDTAISFYRWTEHLAVGEELLLVSRPDTSLYLFGTSNVIGRWETRDIDFGFPGVEKTLSKVIFWATPSSPLAVTVSVSLDGGLTWLWTETITLDKTRSGIVNPWLTGEVFRIRFSAAGLQLSGFYAAAEPRSREAPLA